MLSVNFQTWKKIVMWLICDALKNLQHAANLNAWCVWIVSNILGVSAYEG